MIREISKFIADRSGFTVGDTLQVAHRPPSAPHRCSVVLESVGGGLYADLRDRIDKMIQVISRAKTYMDARDEARTIFNKLHHDDDSHGSWLIDHVDPATQDYRAMTIDALADPQYIGQDNKRRYEFSTNYIFRMQNV